jgi:uncharacterized protein YggE
MSKKIIPAILGILILFSLSAFVTGGGAAAGEPPLRTITVFGTGKTYLNPDIAYINIGDHTENADAVEALASNNAQAQNISDVLQKSGVAAKDIQTTNFSIYPVQKYGPNGEITGITYTVDNTVYVTVRDLTKMGEILSAAVNKGANSINGIQFDVSDRSAASSDARKAAVADAHTQAEELAAAAGVTLGQVQTITVNESEPVTTVYRESTKAADVAGAASSTPISGGQLTITVDATITYTIK